MRLETLYRAITELLDERLDHTVIGNVTIRLDANLQAIVIRDDTWELSLDTHQAEMAMVRLLQMQPGADIRTMKKHLSRIKR